MQPWLVHLAGVLLTGAAAYLAARRGARETTQDRAQRETAAAREEWFRRVQRAAELTLRTDDVSGAAGFALLNSLAESALASDDDLDLISALSEVTQLRNLAVDFSPMLDETDFTTKDETDRPDVAGGTL